MLKSIMINTAVASAITAGLGMSAEARESIVGRWAPTKGQCQSHFDVITIGPKSLAVGDDFFCTFRSVERQGDVVTWRGACGYSENREPSTVVARLQGGRLDIGLNGNRSGIARAHTACPR